MELFAVFDSKAEAYLDPMSFPTTGMAVRAFEASVADPKHDFARFASDYSFFKLGEFDNRSGTFKVLSAPVCVARAHEVLAAAAASRCNCSPALQENWPGSPTT